MEKRKYYQPEAETMPVEDIKELQSNKLVRQIAHVYNNVKYYHDIMDAKGVTPADIHGIEDIIILPFLSKADLCKNYPDGLLAVEKKDCVRIHATSGTTGKRVIAFYTQHDVDLWEECCARAIVAAGCDSDDICQIAYGFGLFTGGFGIYGGSARVGCLTIPTSSGNSDRQIELMQDVGTTLLCCTPSYAAYIGEKMKELGINTTSLSLKAGIFGAEPWTEEMRRDIEKSLGLKAYDIYGLTETTGPGVAFECLEQHGMHINEDHFYAEIVDPDTGKVLPEGEKGELVFTSLDKEAFPMIRYRTHDICSLSREKCSCGRTFIRMTKPMGRSDDMMIIRGVNVFPSQIETVLLNDGYSPNYRIIVDRINNSDTFQVDVELPIDMLPDTISGITGKEKKLSDAIKDAVGVKPVVHLVPPKTIERSEGKAKRVIDKRNLV